MDYIRFNFPAHVDRSGFASYKDAVVSRAMVPVMAAIIEAAIKPTRLTQQYTLDGPASSLDVEQLRDIRAMVRYDLEHGMREDAKKKGLTIITRVKFNEMADATGRLFSAWALAMPLIEMPEGPDTPRLDLGRIG